MKRRSKVSQAALVISPGGRSEGGIRLGETRGLVAPIPGAAAFVDYLKSNLYQPVALLDLAAGIDLTAVPALADPAQQAHALLAIGAALRDEAAP